MRATSNVGTTARVCGLIELSSFGSNSYVVSCFTSLVAVLQCMPMPSSAVVRKPSSLKSVVVLLTKSGSRWRSTSRGSWSAPRVATGTRCGLSQSRPTRTSDTRTSEPEYVAETTHSIVAPRPAV